jgi:NAD(P)-dependent dehydrogenase (short-subunit alcohol dehydrogenase family)
MAGRKSAVVTGSGGGGCGRAIARRLARDGLSIVVSDLDEDGGRETVRLIEEDGGHASFFRADVSSQDDVLRLIAFADDDAPLEVLVNNASTHGFNETLEGWKQQIEVDLLGGLYATWHAIEAMKRNGGGAIVNVTSISALWHGRETVGASPAYDAAKAGLIRLTTGLRSLAASDGIRANCLAPGWIATHGPLEYWQSLTPEERSARGVPSKLLQPDEIAGAVYKLATDKTLAGRVMLWWSEDRPRLIADCDRGYCDSEDFDV